MLAACGLWLDDEAKIERARVALENQQYSAAIIEMKSVLLNAPGNAEAREVLGRALAANGELEAAERHLQQALDQGRSLNDFRVALAEARLATGQPEQALTIADPAQAADDKEAFFLWLYRGDAQYELGDTVDALRSYERAEQLSVDDAAAQLRTAEIFWNEGNLSDAKVFTELVLQNDPRNLDAHLTLGAILMEKLAFPEAKDKLTHALKTLQLDPFFEGYLLASLAEAHLALGDVAAAREISNRVAERWTAEDLDYRFLNAQIALAEGDNKTAATDLLAYLVDHPDSEIAMRKLGAAQLGQGLLEQARIQLNNALAVDPDQVETRQLLARAALTRGEIDRAREVLETALFLDARDPIVLSLLGVLGLPEHAVETRIDSYTSVRDYLTSGEIDQALAVAQWAVSDRRDDARAMNLLGLSQLADGRAPQAVTSFTSALSTEPDNLQYRVNLARAHLANAAPAEGLTVLENLGTTDVDADVSVTRRALVFNLHESTNTLDSSEPEALAHWLAENPDDLDARYMLARSLVDSGSFADAAGQYELLIEQGLDDADIHNNLAWSYLHLRDDRALEHAEYAYGLAPNNGGILDTLGWILVSQGELARGRLLLDDAHILRPGDAEIAYHLAYALSRTGAADEAITILEELLVRGSDADKKPVRELLLQLQRDH